MLGVPLWEQNLQLLTKPPKKPVVQRYNVTYIAFTTTNKQLREHTITVAESESLSKTIRVDIMFGASSTKYNLLCLKKYPIKYEELRLIEA